MATGIIIYNTKHKTLPLPYKSGAHSQMEVILIASKYINMITQQKEYQKCLIHTCLCLVSCWKADFVGLKFVSHFTDYSLAALQTKQNWAWIRQSVLLKCESYAYLFPGSSPCFFFFINGFALPEADWQVLLSTPFYLHVPFWLEYVQSKLSWYMCERQWRIERQAPGFSATVL